mmetsp:Transcript_112864/g.350346  ORF Transcript_112864/g.350346 Transcript_112864/m.350346 type:complete len:212 (+) Transcript_112864:235-870(+)
MRSQPPPRCRFLSASTSGVLPATPQSSEAVARRIQSPFLREATTSSPRGTVPRTLEPASGSCRTLTCGPWATRQTSRPISMPRWQDAIFSRRPASSPPASSGSRPSSMSGSLMGSRPPPASRLKALAWKGTSLCSCCARQYSRSASGPSSSHSLGTFCPPPRLLRLARRPPGTRARLASLWHSSVTPSQKASQCTKTWQPPASWPSPQCLR